MGTKNIINAVRENNPIKLQKALDDFKYCTNEEYDLNQKLFKKMDKDYYILLQSMVVKQYFYIC